MRLWLFVFLGSALWGQFAPAIPRGPKQLQPPKDQALILRVHGKGEQIYVCRKTDMAFDWVLKGPDAKLFGESGELAGKHFAGPTWEANDGSRVIGKIATTQPAPKAGSIPWLLLTMASQSGTGIMARVKSIQRLDTTGGTAPASGCDASHENGEMGVPYEANYYFYGEPHHGLNSR